MIFDKPRIVTEAELIEALMPYIVGYAWALDTIGDLWRMGAPEPNPRPRGWPERRILLPGQFKRWWDDVQRRQGIDPALTANKVVR